MTTTTNNFKIYLPIWNQAQDKLLDNFSTDSGQKTVSGSVLTDAMEPIPVRELIQAPEPLPTAQEAQAWLNATRDILDFWNCEGDAAYDDL